MLVKESHNKKYIHYKISTKFHEHSRVLNTTCAQEGQNGELKARRLLKPREVGQLARDGTGGGEKVLKQAEDQNFDLSLQASSSSHGVNIFVRQGRAMLLESPYTAAGPRLSHEI
jgi:hypothetical protein